MDLRNVRRNLIPGMLLLFALAGCSVDLANKECDSQGKCLQGFVCSHKTHRCIYPGTPEDFFCNGDDLVVHNNLGQESSTPCSLGCDDQPVPSRCYRLQPSNLDDIMRPLLCAGTQPLHLSANASLDTDSGIITDGDGTRTAEQFTALSQQVPGAPSLGVFSFADVQISNGVRVTVSGTNALVLLACQDIVIDGLLDLSGGAGEMKGDGTGIPGKGGPGGFDGGAKGGGAGLGIGPGTGGSEAGCDSLKDSGGAGAGFGGKGGAGGDGGDPRTCGATGPSGAAGYGGVDIVPLVGGSGGGGGGDPSAGPGGGGGGAVQISAGGTISIGTKGGILTGGGGGAGGHDGQDSSAGGGGGSGGAILLEAAQVSVAGVLAANGGGGGAGYFENKAYGTAVAESGKSGLLGTDLAAGGRGSGIGGTGGDGGAGTRADGQPGQSKENGGGGGGGTGRLRINTRSGLVDATRAALFSPSDRADRCQGLCTEGTAKRW